MSYTHSSTSFVSVLFACTNVEWWKFQIMPNLKLKAFAITFYNNANCLHSFFLFKEEKKIRILSNIY